MAKNYDIIIIGAGIFGCAIFHALAQQRLGKILLIEKSHIASGTTGQSGGLIRKFYLPTHLQKIAEFSFDYYKDFSTIVGGSCGFRQTGCYYIFPNISDDIQQQFNYLNNANYPIELIDPKSTVDNILNNSNDYLLFEPLAGCIDTHLACKSWVTAGLNSNSHLRENTLVEELIIHNEKILGVKANDDIIYANHVILAAGAWSTSLLSKKHIYSNFNSKAFQYHLLHQPANQFKSAILDMRHQLYIVPNSNNEIIAGSFGGDITINTDNLLPKINSEQTQSLLQSLSLRLPWINNTIQMTNHMATDAFHNDSSNFFEDFTQTKGLYHVAIGNSGGIKIAPAIAKSITDYFDRSHHANSSSDTK